MNLRATICATIIIFLSHQLSAQNGTASCGWIKARSAQQQKDPLFSLHKTAAERKINDYLQSHRMQYNDTLYTLPVVVHIIHTGTAIGSPDNPTDPDINAMNAELKRGFPCQWFITWR
jgi:hypothetical protein